MKKIYSQSKRSRILNAVLRKTARSWFRRGTDIEKLRRRVSRLSGWLTRLPRETDVDYRYFKGMRIDQFSFGKPQGKKALLYLHGGGFVLPALSVHYGFCAYLAEHTNSDVFMPHYRLAPEHPFPAAPEDCLLAYKWLLEIGYKAENITIAGDSAGGNLTLVTLMQIRDQQLGRPHCGVLLSPLTDFNCETPSFESNKDLDPCFEAGAVPFIRALYLQNNEDFNDLRISPLTHSFSDLPPMLYLAGSTEMLRDDSVFAHEKAYVQSGNSKLIVIEKMPHVFPLIHILPEGKKASAEIVEFINSQ